jgi:hypothetical protein
VDSSTIGTPHSAQHSAARGPGSDARPDAAAAQFPQQKVLPPRLTSVVGSEIGIWQRAHWVAWEGIDPTSVAW